MPKEVSNFCSGTITECTVIGTQLSGIAGYYYYADIDLCGLSCPEITLSFSTCCRGYGINSGAGGAGVYQSIKIPLNISNSAPRFENPPILFMVSGQSMNVMQAAYDKDGDSLVYSLTAPLMGSNSPVFYYSGYSPQAPLGSSGNVSIDAQSGILSINTV